MAGKAGQTFSDVSLDTSGRSCNPRPRPWQKLSPNASISLVKPMWNWNIAKPLDNSPLPGKLDWQRFLGSAPVRELEPMRFRSWRYFWDYAGGNMTDQGTHLMDVVQWFTNSGPPLSAIAHGQVVKMTGSEHPEDVVPTRL